MERKEGNQVMVVTAILIVLSMAGGIFIGAVFMHMRDLTVIVAPLQQQLAKAEDQVQANAGLPVNVIFLPSGKYSLTKPKGYAFVERHDAHPFADTVFAVMCNGKIPNEFTVDSGRLITPPVIGNTPN